MNTKKIISGVAAIICAASFTACGDSENTQESSQATSATTTDVTVEINTEALKQDAEALESVMSQLSDVELENKEIKWLAHYDLNPNTSDGASKESNWKCLKRNTAAQLSIIPLHMKQDTTIFQHMFWAVRA